MAQYKLADGTTVEAPADLTREEKAWLRAQGGLERQSQAADVVKSSVSGLGEGALRTPFIGGDLWGLGATLLEKLRPGSTTEQNRRSQSQEVIDTLGVPLYKPETKAGEYANSIANAVGGGLVLPGGGVKTAIGTGINIGRAPGIAPAIGAITKRAVQTPILQNAAIGAGAQLGGDVSSKFGEQAENPLMRVAGGAGTALLAAVAARGTTPRFAGSASRAMEDLKPQDWQNAAKINADMTRGGATSQTVADLLPETSKLRAVTQEMSNAPGAGELYSKLAGRENGEIADILTKARQEAQGLAVPGSMPAVTEAQNSELYRKARGSRTDALKAELKDAPLLEESKLQAVIESLRAKANLPENRGGSQFGGPDFTPRIEGASRLDDMPRYGLPEQSIPVTRGPGELTGGPAAPTASPQAPQAALPQPGLALPAPTGSAMSVPQIAENAVTSPGMPSVADVQGRSVGQGSGFTFPSNQPITDILPERGVNLEALSKIVKSIDTIGSTSSDQSGKLLKAGGAIGAQKDAETALKTLSPEYRASQEAYIAKSPQVDITEGFVDNMLRAEPHTASMKQTTKSAREGIAEALAKLDPTQAEMFTNRLATADRLAMLKPQQGAEGMQQELKQTMVGSVAQPFGAISRRAGIASQLQGNEQLARLIANPTPGNMAILEALGKNNPDLARKIRELSNLGAVNASSRVEN